ncbi:MAG: glycoside hydrolase family 97 protein [bacterium]
MKRIYVILYSIVFFSVSILNCSKLKSVQSITSPDGKMTIHFSLTDSSPSYWIDYKKQTVINTSRLGFDFKNIPPLKKNFQILNSSFSKADSSWSPVWGIEKKIQNMYNEMIITLEEKNESKRTMKIIFRAYNDGVAFRYVLPNQTSMDSLNITSENTEFNLTDNHTVWWYPADYESYEHLYRTSRLVELNSTNTPLTIKTDKGIYISIHEADLTDYADMTLQKAKNTQYNLTANLVPWPDGIKIKASLPMKTPWRTIQICNNPGDLITSTLILNLNKSCKLQDTSWIKPIKYIGIWWGMHIRKHTWYAGPNHGATTENSIKYIDFAADNKISGLLIEGWNQGWETWGSEENIQNYTKSYPDFNLEKVARYARKRGIELIGHHETGGNVPNYEKQLDDAFTYYKNLGISYVKTGYAGRIIPKGMHHHGQWMVNHYRKVVKKAAEYQIMIDAHEPIKPTGISRTYPHMMTREGGRGMEYNAWSEGNTPEHTTILPFTRLLAGPMDYTPGIFDLYFNKYQKVRRVWTTLSKQLAYYVILYSPLQMASDLIENYKNQTAFTFIQDVPVTWDATKVISSEIGDYIIMVRKYKNQWFLGGITDEYPRQLSISLDFLENNKKYIAEIYCDDIETGLFENPTKIEIGTYAVNSNDSLNIALSTSGGIAVKFIPFNKSSKQPINDISLFNQKTPLKMKQFKNLQIYDISKKQ